MTDSIFITLDYLKANTTIQENVDGATIRPFIVLAMDKYALDILGTTLYNRLIDDVQTNSLSGNYLTLMQVYIQPMLTYYVQYEGLEFFTSQITNKGIVNKNSDNSSTTDEDRIIRMENKLFQNGNYYAQRLIRYLKANRNLFPELTTPDSSCDTISPANTEYFSGIHIPGRRCGFGYFVRDINGNIIYPNY